MDTETQDEICTALENRSAFYTMLAGFYFKPLSQKQIDQMAKQDFAALATGDELIDEGFDDIRRVLRKRHTGTRSQLATEWTGTFGGAESYEGHYCTPNASVFLDESGTTYGWPRNEVRKMFLEQGFYLAGDAGMPESHLTFELEFLAALSNAAADDLRSGDVGAALEKVRLSRRFIEEHVLEWFPALEKLAMKMLKTRFYRGVLKITKGYLALDLDMLDDIESEMAGK